MNTIAQAIRDSNGQQRSTITQAAELIEQLASAHHRPVDRTTVRRALTEAMHAWRGDEQNWWWKWLVEAGKSVGLRIRPLDGSLSQVLDIVQFGTVAATWLPENSSGGRGLAINEESRHKFRVTLTSSTSSETQQYLDTRRQLTHRLQQRGVSDTTRWVVVEQTGILDHDENLGPHSQSPLSRLWSFMRPEGPDIWVVLVFSLFVGFLALATPIAVESLVTTVAFGQLLQPVVVLSLMLFVFLLFAAGMRAVQTYVVEIIQRRIFARVAGELAWRLPRVHQDAYDRAYGPELVNRFFDVMTVQKTASSLLLDGVTLIIGTFTGMAVLAFYHPWLLGFDVFLLILIAFTVFVLGRGAVPSSITESKAKYRTAAWLNDLSRCSSTFKMEGGPDFAVEQANCLTADYLSARETHFRILMRQILFALFLQALATTVLLGLGGWLVIRGQLTLGQLVAAEMIVTIIVGLFAKLGKHMDAFYDLLAAMDKLGQLFDLPLERQDGLMYLGETGPAEVRLHGVSYHYPDRPPILRNVTARFSPGHCIAITGPSGAGKSTLLDLLYGLRVPDAGHIELDFVDLRDLRPDVLRHHVGLVRGVEIFQGTLADNVHLHRPGITMVEIRDAIQKVGLLNDVLRLPDALHTKLESGGSLLSGTQAHRLMLARALVGRPRLLLIDGLLDILPDEECDSLLSQLKSDDERTIVLVSRRRQILDQCDQVISLPDMEATTKLAEQEIKGC